MNAEREHLYRVLGRLESKTDAMHEDIRSHIASDAIWQSQLDQRIRALETGAARVDEITNRIILKSPSSFPPAWVRNVLSRAIVKIVLTLLAGGGIGMLARSLVH